MMTAARTLFLIVGVLWALVGVLTPLLIDRGIDHAIFVTERTDTALFGGPPKEILDSNPELRTLRYVLIRALAGLLVAAGLFTVGIAWFGLKEPQLWALALLTVVGLAVIPFWWISLAPYRNANVRLGLGDVPPFMWFPAIAMPIASVMGWIDHLR